MNILARNKPAGLKVSRGSPFGALQTRGPFSGDKKPLASARTPTSRDILQTQGYLVASKPKYLDRTTAIPGPVQTRQPFSKGNQSVSLDKTSGNKLAAFKIARGSATRIGPLRTQGPFPVPKKPSIITKLKPPRYFKASEPKSSGNQPVPFGKTTGNKPGNKPVSMDKASGNKPGNKPVSLNKTSGNKPAVLKLPRGSATRIGPLRTLGPGAKKTPSVRSFINRGLSKTQGHLLKGSNLKSEPKSQTKTQGPLKGNKPVSSGQAFTNPRPVQTPGPKKSVPATLDRGPTNRFRTVFPSKTTKSLPAAGVSTIYRPVKTLEPNPISKISQFSGSKVRERTLTSLSLEQTPGLKTGKASPPLKAPETLSSVSRNLHSPSRIPGLAQKQGPFLSTRTPTSPGILQNRRTLPKPGEFGSSLIRNMANVYSSPSYILGPKVPVQVDEAPKSGNAVRNASRIPRGSLPKPSQSIPSGNRNLGGAGAPDPVCTGLKSTELVASEQASTNPVPVQTKRHEANESVTLVKENQDCTPTSPVPTQTAEHEAIESVALAKEDQDQNKEEQKDIKSVTLMNENQDSVSGKRRLGMLRTTRSRIPLRSDQTSCTLPGQSDKVQPDPTVPDKKQNLNTKPEASPKQGLKGSLPGSPSNKSKLTPRRGLAFQPDLADELDKRNLFINELKIKLVQSQNLVSEQELRLAESKSVQMAKDVAMKQLKSKLLTAKDEYDRMHLRLQETDFGLEQATSKANKYLEQYTSVEGYLTEARDMIGNQQRQLKDADKKAEIHCQTEARLRQDVERMQEQLALDSQRIHSLEQNEKDLRRDLEKRDSLIYQINQELATRDEEFRNLFETLKHKHTQLRSQEQNIKRLEGRYERVCLIRSKLEERNAALLDRIEQLKDNLRNYSQIIIGNGGKPFYEEVLTGINPGGLAPEKEFQRNVKPKRRDN
ncbi:uncharacterized protein [Drosophila kikkawai]|uniref:Uncharacterized protein n=1 Tax=Drosophila kikkawai TaxID=30033 RepID=A0ABM4GA75_DROKI|nr:endo-1,4-beta-xylanase B-like [Drosophila kikkawai]